MRANIGLGLVQGIFLPQPRPARAWLGELGTSIELAGHQLAANAMSASAMWAANAATVSPAPDAADGKCHLTVANLKTMPHRSHEWPATLAQLRLAFASDAFAVHGPVPTAFGDEGAANHMRLAPTHGDPGVEVFVYGVTGGPFPARQHIEASRAIARLHRLDPDRTIFAPQSEAAWARSITPSISPASRKGNSFSVSPVYGFTVAYGRAPVVGCWFVGFCVAVTPVILVSRHRCPSTPYPARAGHARTVRCQRPDLESGSTSSTGEGARHVRSLRRQP
jgi:hypothetical protein